MCILRFNRAHSSNLQRLWKNCDKSKAVQRLWEIFDSDDLQKHEKEKKKKKKEIRKQEEQNHRGFVSKARQFRGVTKILHIDELEKKKRIKIGKIRDVET
jgi:hypothetical protein